MAFHFHFEICSSCRHFVKNASGWLLCLLDTCPMNDFNLANVIKACFVENKLIQLWAICCKRPDERVGTVTRTVFDQQHGLAQLVVWVCCLNYLWSLVNWQVYQANLNRTYYYHLWHFKFSIIVYFIHCSHISYCMPKHVAQLSWNVRI